MIRPLRGSLALPRQATAQWAQINGTAGSTQRLKRMAEAQRRVTDDALTACRYPASWTGWPAAA